MKVVHFALWKFRIKRYDHFFHQQTLLILNKFAIICVQGNPVIFIEANIHAGEWITSSTATYFLNELLSSNKSEIRYLVDNYDWIIVPVVNVDGFFYSHTTVNEFELWK